MAKIGWVIVILVCGLFLFTACEQKEEVKENPGVKSIEEIRAEQAHDHAADISEEELIEELKVDRLEEHKGLLDKVDFDLIE